MNAPRWMILLLSLTALSALAQHSQPYQWSHSLEGETLSIQVSIPEGAYLYADQTRVTLDPDSTSIETPTSHEHTDDFGTSQIYEGETVHRWAYQIDPQQPYQVDINYQGCGTADGSSAVCFPPASETFTVHNGLVTTQANISETPLQRDSLQTLLDRFEVVRTDGGMKKVDEFLTFLNLDQPARSSSTLLEGKSTWLMLLLVLLGGLALNLTPCVLPMIPINLAIIGAGAGAATKTQGFIRGGVYGAGIALAYGGLGLFAVLTGSKFGTLNASPLFNFIIASIFLLLALAMFDVLNIDLSRFGARFGISNEKRGKLLPVFILGIVAALLAGACVAPIVIAVLLQSATLYANGNEAGLFLPLLLGIGMALPWPIAGAGLTRLPKPGNWMVKIKYSFGILIILFALYYTHLGMGLLPKKSASGYSTATEILKLETQLDAARLDGRPVFIDVWATWCKNCLQMEATTFKDPAVIERLTDFNVIKFQAEKPADPEIKSLLDRYNLPGLPGYVILKPTF